MWNVNDGRRTNDGQRVITIVHVSLWLRCTNKSWYINLLKCADSLKFMYMKVRQTQTFGKYFLGIVLTTRRRDAIVLPSRVLLAKNSHLRVAFVWNVGDTRCLHDGNTRASRSRVAFLTQLVNFVCPSCFPRVWFGSHRVAFRGNRGAFGWKLFCYHLRE